ncbi:MAG: chemotaxis protein CheW [Nitrospiria bacterium]
MKKFIERGEERRKSERDAAGRHGRREKFSDRRHGNNKQYVTFFLENYYLGVSVEKIQEVFQTKEMTGVPLAPEGIAGLINLRGHIISTIDLRRALGFGMSASKDEMMSVVVRTTEGEINLLVDKIGDVIEVLPVLFEPAPKTLDEHLLKVVEGIYKLDDRLLLVLNTEAISKIGEPAIG